MKKQTTIIYSIFLILGAFLVYNYINKEFFQKKENHCKEFKEERIFFTQSRRDSLGLLVLNKNDFKKSINKGRFLVTYEPLNKKKYPFLKVLEYQCTSREEIYTFYLTKYVEMTIYYGENSKPTTWISVENKKIGETSFPSKKESYLLLKKHGLVNTNSDYFYGYKISKLLENQ